MARGFWPSIALVLLVLWVQPATAIAAPASEEVITASLTRCEARLAAHLAKAESTQRTANVLLVVGALVAALGNALAPFLKKAPLRKATAVLGAIGAVMAVVPKTLDEPAKFRTLHANAERHRDIAVKVHMQFSLITDAEAKAVLSKYVIARLADCESGNPSSQPPEPPVHDGTSGVATAGWEDASAYEPNALAAEPASEAVLSFGPSTMTRPEKLSGPIIQYTRDALDAQVEGLMVVKCVITTEGKAERCRTLKSLPHMERSVLDALYAAHYKPVTFKGRPVQVDYTFNIKLFLPR
jgi:TonB family protein